MPENNNTAIENLLTTCLALEPTKGQIEALKLTASLIFDKQSYAPVLLIKGYAGTGKTTIVSALVKALPQLKLNFILLAPTGRSAKVLAGYTNNQAHTIHRKIYIIKTTPNGTISLTLNKNKHQNSIFIVDEASMIGDGSTYNDSAFANTNLLADLFEYVFSGTNCKLILIGDTAQLPPVKMDKSPALNEKVIANTYSDEILKTELTEVVRQAKESGILYNATAIREQINKGLTSDFPCFSLKGFNDIFAISGTDLEDRLNYAYGNYNTEEVAILCRTNKRANQFNQEIRRRILFHESEICSGDLMMVVRNNYFWLDESSTAGFIANGDMIEILKIKKYESLYGFNFAHVIIRLVDYPNEKELETILLLDTIMSDAPSLSFEDNNKLFNNVMEDYADIPQRGKKIEKVKSNPHFNALQVKFAYAITCHKAQGGQWRAVFIDKGYLTKEMINTEYYRWLYTAITRATDKLYLVNFDEMFFKD